MSIDVGKNHSRDAHAASPRATPRDDRETPSQLGEEDSPTQTLRIPRDLRELQPPAK